MPSFLSTYALPLGVAVAGLCVIVAVALVLRSRRATEQSKLTDEQRAKLAQERRESWRRGLSVFALGVGCLMLFAIAGTAGWLSFAAQREYAHSRNGGSWDHATGFALLLDAGALGLSLFRFFEALTLRSSTMTRLFLFGFIGASSAMNYLHAPENEGGSVDFGSRFVAVVPPLVYAVLLEMLLHKIEQVIMGKRPARKKQGEQRGYSLLLWLPWPIGSPIRMWRAWRQDLLDTIANVRAPGSRKPTPEPLSAPAPAPAPSATPTVAAVETSQVEPRRTPQEAPAAIPASRTEVAPHEPQPTPSVAPAGALAPPSAATPPPGQASPSITPAPTPGALAPPSAATPPPVQAAGVSNVKPKKDQLRDALVAQILAGDTRVLDSNAQVANGAAYRANMALGQAAGLGLDRDGKQEGLMKPGAVRAAVKQLLPELRRVATEAEAEAERAHRAAAAVAPEPVPQHHAAGAQAPDADAPRERQEDEEPVIGQQRSADASEEAKEAALA